MSPLARTLSKSEETRSEDASQTRRATNHLRKALLFKLKAAKLLPKVYKAALGGPLGPPLALLEYSWGAAGDAWGALGALWGSLGPLLGRSWSAHEALLGTLERSGVLLGAPWAIFGLILALPRSILELDFGPETIKLRAIWRRSW